MNAFVFRFLGIIQCFVGLGALVSGGMLIHDSTGALLQMTPDMLKGTPFTSFLIPGIILFAVNGLGQIAGGVLSFRKHRLTGLVAAVFGLGLIIWIFVQVNMIGGGHWLQYTYFGFGVAETALAFPVQGLTGVISGRARKETGR
jgi:hypothetical protein